MNTKPLFWSVTAMTVTVYAAMLVWTLPAIAAAAGGLMPFDMRPGGYSYADAREFLSALTAEGRAFYADVQLKLDVLYPGLLALTLCWAIAALAPQQRPRLRFVLAAAALPLAAFDYCENWAIAQMLAMTPEALTPDLVATASTWTILKGQATTVAMSLLLVLLCWRAVMALRRRSQVASPSVP